MKEILFYKTQKDAAAKPFSRMPPRYAGRVKILPAATLFIERVDLSDESFYMCEITTPFLTIRKAINLTVIGKWNFFSFESSAFVSLFFFAL